MVGAGPGLGLAAARAFARDGYDVALVGRSADTLERLAGEVEQAAPVDVGWAPVDVADPDALTAALQRFVAHTGRLDVLHHNVSVYRSGGVEDVTAEQLLADVAVGTASLLSAVRAVLPALADARGSVLVTGSGAADRPDAGALTLGVQKAGVRALLQALAPGLRERGVHAATLTVHGVLREGTAFDPARVAERLVGLAARRHDDPATWQPVHDLRAAGEDAA